MCEKKIDPLLNETFSNKSDLVFEETSIKNVPKIRDGGLYVCKETTQLQKFWRAKILFMFLIFFKKNSDIISLKVKLFSCKFLKI